MHFILAAAVTLFAAASFADLRWRRIPNALVLAVSAVALVRIGLKFDPIAVGFDVAAATLLFLLLMVAWARNLLGAGDVKLAAAAALLVGHEAVLGFLLLTTLFGGALALLALADAWMARSMGRSTGFGIPTGPVGVPDLEMARPSVPYGVAISVAAAITLFVSPPTG